VKAAAFGAFMNRADLHVDERIIVVDAVADAFAEKFAPRPRPCPLRRIARGQDPARRGRRPQDGRSCHALIEDALAKGAVALAGGTSESC